MHSRKLRINNKGILNLPIGTIKNVSVDNDGIPFSKFWRDRLKDAERDNCCEFISETKNHKKEKKEVEKDGS